MAERNEIAGDHYAGLIEERLTEERARKASLEQRGFSIVTTSGALVTLLFAVTTLTLGEDAPELPLVAYIALIFGLALFISAGALGLMISIPRTYQEPDVPTLRGFVEDDAEWHGDAVEGQQSTAEVRLEVVEDADAWNSKKASMLKWGVWLEVGAVGMVAVAVLATLTFT